MFDPTKRVIVEVKAIRRARLIQNLKLWALATAIVSIPFILILWAIWEYL
jgi:hypothetical protein